MSNLIIEAYNKRENVIVPTLKPNNNNISAENKTIQSQILPTTLIVGGSILVATALLRPSSTKILQKYASKQLEQMNKLKQALYQNLENLTTKEFKDYNYINQFIDSKQINKEILNTSRLNTSKKPQFIIALNDIIFNQINNLFKTHAGGSDFDLFLKNFTLKQRKLLGQIRSEKTKTQFEITDLAKLPRLSGKIKEDIRNNELERLEDAKNTINKEIDEYTPSKLLDYRQTLSRQMLKTIEDLKNYYRNYKEESLNISFARIRELLSLPKDLKPSYNEMFEITEPLSFSPETIRILDKLEKITEGSYYLTLLKHSDIGRFDQSALEKLFYSTPQEESLKELSYLIDRVRLRQVISQTPQDFDSIIHNLKYLHTILTKFGQSELEQETNHPQKIALIKNCIGYHSS